MNPPERFDTPRLILRKPRVDDAPAIFEAYAQDPEVTRHLTWRPHRDLQETYAIIGRIIDSWTVGETYSFAITLKHAEALVGMLAMHMEGSAIGLGYVLARTHWGNGYMTEAVRAVVDWALNQPDIFRVFATCGVENLASARVMEKAGMVREGLLRRHIVHPNVSDEPVDSFIYAIVR
ncbi:MAG TPA: GNAT family N-acetyltransferase [Anaerolineales bacterium]